MSDRLVAKEVPYSSIVGSSVTLSKPGGPVVVQLIISVPNPQFDYKAESAPVIRKILEAFNGVKR